MLADQSVQSISSRRLWLQQAGSGLAGTALASLSGIWSQLAASQTAGTGKAKSVILIFNCGAPSHLDLWDPKPDAADNIRGEFQPISTKVSGIQISELLPRMAERADKLAIVRSLQHQHGGHNSGMYWTISGHPYRVDSTLINPSVNDHPSFGTLVGWLAQRDGYSGAVPPYVITPYPHCDSTVYITPGQYGGCLGVKYDPFVLNADPALPNFRVQNLRLDDGLSNERLQQRLGLLGELSQTRAPLPSSSAKEYDMRRTQAASMVLSGEAAKAFDLSQEPDKVRDRYGRHTWGQSHLLARRLVEAGVPFVTTVNGQGIVWDTHKDNFNGLKNRLVPPMETAYAALLDDLDERGLLDSTLVVWLGDFGRSPIINKTAGRDHWPQCYSAVLAGGGIKGGQVVGASDRTGSYPHERPLSPADLHATVFQAMGYDSKAISYRMADGRPMPLSDGTPIRELLS